MSLIKLLLILLLTRELQYIKYLRKMVRNYLSNDEIINNYSKIHSKYSKHLFKAHNTIAVRNKIDGACMKLWDDLLPVFMLYPELFSVNKEKDNSSVYLVKCLVCSMIKEKIYQLLRIETVKVLFYSISC